MSGNDQDYKKGIECFKCGRMGHFTKDCTHDKKENGNELNTEEVIKIKYQEKSDAKRARIVAAIGGKKAMKAEEGGAEHFIDSAIIPRFDEQIVIEGDHDGYDHDAFCHNLYQFMMLVGRDDSRVIKIDLRATNHVLNQSGKTLRSFEVLSDSQSTCDVIINEAMVINI